MSTKEQRAEELRAAKERHAGETDKTKHAAELAKLKEKHDTEEERDRPAR